MYILAIFNQCSNFCFRQLEYKPSPPPKSSNYKPVPPPKPKHYRPPVRTNSDYDDYSSSPSYYNQRTPPTSSLHRYDEDNGGFDSGHGSSLDRNYDSNGGHYSSRSAAAAQQSFYLNVPPPSERGPQDGLNHDKKGSAFELYRKPEFQPLINQNGRYQPYK